MEEKGNQIYLLCEVLNERFDRDQWLIIKSQPPDIFLKRQQIILAKLLQQKKLFQKYFNVFYSNHVKLLNWSILAVQFKCQILPYVFKSLVSKGNLYFDRQIKEIFNSKLKKKQQQKEQLDLKQIKQMQMKVYQQFFYQMLVRNSSNQETYTHKTHHLNQKQNRKQQNMDSHDFYIKTFNACNGWKYIFYNYQKHMKGLSEKFKYNDQIRGNQQKNSNNLIKKNNLGLLNYQHQPLLNNQNKIINFSTFINNMQINSPKKLRKVAAENQKNKLCFRNHQGKPISYRISKM